MKNNQIIEQELKQLEVKLPICQMPQMAVPSGYFETFSSSLLETIQQEEFLDNLPKDTPYQVDPDYFENFEANLHEQLQQDFINNLPKQTPYQIPVNYFETLPATLLSQINPSQKSLYPLSLSFSNKLIARLSLAATLLLFMGIAFKGFIATPSQTKTAASVEHQLASLSDNEIDQYLQKHQAEIENSLTFEAADESKLDVEKLEAEILDHALNQISDEELLKYNL